MKIDESWIVVGRFGRPQGVKGLVSVISFTEPTDNILDYKNWHMVTGSEIKPLNLVQTAIHGKRILVQVNGCEDRDQAGMFTNIDIVIKRDQLPKLASGEYYWHDLVGMQVINQQGVMYGKVTEVMPTGSADVLVIEGETRVLIPYLPGHYVMDIDPIKRLITVDWEQD